MDRDLIQLFTNNGLRMTAPRRAVFETLQLSDKPLSAAGIAKACAKQSDRTSVYRTLDLFIKLEIVHPVSHGWKRLYELADPFRAHHHHLNCKHCGRIIDFELPELEKTIAAVAKAHNFSAQEHMFEIRGVCNNCSA